MVVNLRSVLLLHRRARIRVAGLRINVVHGLVATALACGRREAPLGPPQTEKGDGQVCARDWAREYLCDELLPLGSSLPAPPPYTNCPSTVEGAYGELEARSRVIVFDPSYTRYTRHRLPPGNTCCYSWCSQVTIVDPNRVDPYARCRHPLAMRETYCVDELESGTSTPGFPPYERCPRAISPPAARVFFAPGGALFDSVLTLQKRQQGFGQCCYAWCSLAPPNSGLQGR